MHVSHSDESRKNWGLTVTDPKTDRPSLDQLQFGCIQRIANSLEGINLKLGVMGDLQRYKADDHKKIERLKKQVKKLKAELLKG